MQSTLQLFQHLYDHLPPLFPSDIAQKMQEAIVEFEERNDVSVEEVEKAMIKFGYEAWPYNKAYREFYLIAEDKLGEQFLVPRLSLPVQEKYLHYKTLGMTLRDLHSGRPAEYFSDEERGELCEALVAMQIDLCSFTDREVVGTKKKQYLQKINDFKDLLENIKKHLDSLRKLADKEGDHQMLADEIRARVENFEHGLCLLAPELDYEAVCQSVEHFQGRKKDLNRLRGIHETVEIDFYSEE